MIGGCSTLLYLRLKEIKNKRIGCFDFRLCGLLLSLCYDILINVYDLSMLYDHFFKFFFNQKVCINVSVINVINKYLLIQIIFVKKSIKKII